MLVEKDNNEYNFRPIQPRLVGNAISLDLLIPPYAPPFKITARYPNPLLKNVRVQKLRKGLIKWLEGK